MKKNSFVFYTEWKQYLTMLTSDEIKNLIFIACDYVEQNQKNLNKPNLSDRLLMVWLFIKNQLDKDKTKYDKRCETSKINGQKGGRPKKPKNLNKPKKADNDNEYDNDNIISDVIEEQEEDNLFSYVEKNFGRTLSPAETETILEWEDTELTRYAIKQAMLNGAPNVKYMQAILDSYKTKNIKTVAEAQVDEKKFKQTKNQKPIMEEKVPEWFGKEIKQKEISDERKAKAEAIRNGTYKP